jgi:hypothetical protein
MFHHTTIDTTVPSDWNSYPATCSTGCWIPSGTVPSKTNQSGTKTISANLRHMWCFLILAILCEQNLTHPQSGSSWAQRPFPLAPKRSRGTWPRSSGPKEASKIPQIKGFITIFPAMLGKYAGVSFGFLDHDLNPNGIMWLKQFHKPSPSNHHFHRWYV